MIFIQLHVSNFVKNFCWQILLYNKLYVYTEYSLIGHIFTNSNTYGNKDVFKNCFKEVVPYHIQYIWYNEYPDKDTTKGCYSYNVEDWMVCARTLIIQL